MEKAVKLLLIILLPGLGFSQQITTFDDLAEELEEQTSYTLSYPQTIAQYPIHGSEQIDISDLESLQELLRKSGIRMTSRKKVLIFKALKPNSISKASSPLQITGYVRDAESGESLIGAHVIDTQTGAGVSTNVYGFFSLTVVGDSLEIGFVGYERSKIPVKGDGKELIIELGISEQLLDEVTITDRREIQEINRMSTANLAPRQIKSMPVFMGESDLLKALQLLPGVQSGGEGTSGLYVRGGGPDQNLILLDGVPVYNANHLYGFFSVFNTDALNSVKLIKGGFPARYGGRLSSVIDIQMKEGNLNKVEGEGAIGLIASKMTVSGPIRKGKTSYMISGRRTYLDLFVVPIAKATGARPITGYYFWDLNTKINHVISSRDRIYLSAYMGRDRFYEIFKNNPEPQFEEKEKSNLRWGNITTSFRWNHKFSDRLFSNLTAIMAHYKFKLDSRIDFRSLGEDSTHIFRKNSYFSSISDVGIKYDFNYYLNNQNQVRFGANLVQHRFEPGISAYESLAQSDTTFGANLIHLLEYYAYVEDDITFTSSTKLNMGIHYSGAQVNGTTYHSFQPRLTFTQKLAPKWSLKASYADMAQYIHLLVNSGVGLPTDLWVPSTEKVKPQTSRQYALGLATTQKDLAISVETYYKEMNNLIEYKDGAGFLDVVNEWEDKLEFGKGKSYGVEFLVRKDVGRSTGWLGYTWSKTDRSFPNLNYGKTFPYRYDRRHDLSIVYNLKVNNRIDFGAVWVFGTGNAITLPTASYPKAVWDTTGPNYEETSKHYPGRNSSRMRDYHRLDLNVSFSKKKKWGERKWVFGVYNAYSRLNPVFIDFENSVSDTGTGRFKQLSLFPIIPNVSYQFKF